MSKLPDFILLESLLIVGSNLGAPLGSFVIKFIMNPGESDISSERFQQILVSRGLPSQPEPCQVCLGYFY